MEGIVHYCRGRTSPVPAPGAVRAGDAPQATTPCRSGEHAGGHGNRTVPLCHPDTASGRDGPGTRTGREVVALGVSLANRCPFCVAAHTTLLHATGDHRLAETVAAGGVPGDPELAALLSWAKNARVPAPFPAPLAPAYVGTVPAFHFVNRVAAWRTPATTDEDLVRLIAFGAITATERVESLLRLVRERA
ncbi:MAG: carboxymuconolactone decarboxylase family protein [Nonomuraea sp.]|nr:carboxymuconolactone decarboxylase family protein [Nonomuraea sp.]